MEEKWNQSWFSYETQHYMSWQPVKDVCEGCFHVSSFIAPNRSSHVSEHKITALWLHVRWWIQSTSGFVRGARKHQIRKLQYTLCTHYSYCLIAPALSASVIDWCGLLISTWILLCINPVCSLFRGRSIPSNLPARQIDSHSCNFAFALSSWLCCLH